MNVFGFFLKYGKVPVSFRAQDNFVEARSADKCQGFYLKFYGTWPVLCRTCCGLRGVRTVDKCLLVPVTDSSTSGTRHHDGFSINCLVMQARSTRSTSTHLNQSVCIILLLTSAVELACSRMSCSLKN